MDIVWHTHQVNPQIYMEDMARILGRPLNHDDSVNDRSPGSKLTTTSAVTVDLWRETFGESFAQPGAMYRGQPPRGKLMAGARVRARQLTHAETATVAVNQLKFIFPEP